MTTFNPTDFTSLKNAKNAALPGDVIVIPTSGIVINDVLNVDRPGYKIIGQTPSAFLKWDSAAVRQPAMVQLNGAGDNITLQDLTVDGSNVGGIGVQMKAGRSHAIFNNVFVRDCTANGFAVEACDYVYHLACQSWRNGHPSLTDGSGFSYNVGGTTIADDGYAGLHIVYHRCIATGSEGEPADGNGFIVDNGNAAGTVTIPNLAFISCLATWNGGRGFHNFRCVGRAGARGIVAVNCASRHDGLDTQLGTPPGTLSSPLGEFSNDQGTFTLINCWADPWHGPATPANWGTKGYKNINAGTLNVFNCYEKAGGRYTSDVAVTSFATTPWTSPLAAPSDAGTQQHLLAPDTRTVASGLALLASSALTNAGTNPLAVSGFTTQQLTDLAAYVGVDLAGVSRPQ